jgi:hypothetical protein
MPVEIESVPADGLPDAAATAAYFVVSEALTNVAKYARADHATVAVRRVGDNVVVEVSDDGVGGADPARGSGLRGLSDRVAALDGRLELHSPAGEGTRVRAEIPCGAGSAYARVVADADAYAIEAELVLRDDYDPAAVGAAVTVELCGHWEHEGPCRWPHNSAIDTDRDPARFRTVFVADGREAGQVRDRIETVLRSELGWRLASLRERPVAEAERALAENLLAGPRAG